MADIVWKDELLPGASRIPLPWDGSLLPGWVLDTYGPPTERNDWVRGPNGVPVISGSSEAQPGAGPQGTEGNAALYAALSSQQGRAAQAAEFARRGIEGLHQQILASRGPTIGGHNIASQQASPFLAALGLGPQQKSPEEEERERLKALGYGVVAN